MVEGEQSFYGRAQTIAHAAAKHTDNPDMWAAKFFELIWKGWMSCSTPVLANMGTTRGFPVSCSGQYVGDSVDEFYTNLHEAAMLSKMGFGTSSYLGDIRERGAPISKGGKAQGILPVFEDFVTMASKVSQGGTRRGSWAGYVPISHPDFQEIRDYIYDKPDEVNLGWNWYDSDTEKMLADEPELKSRFKKIMKLAAVQGKGYLFFPDKANRQAPQMYKDLGLKIKSSNLCLTGDTLIEIAKDVNGLDSIKMEIKSYVELWNYGFFSGKIYIATWKDGKKIWSEVSAAAKTGVAKKMIKITTESGKIVECTPDHQIYTQNRGWVAAKNLREDDSLVEI